MVILTRACSSYLNEVRFGGAFLSDSESRQHLLTVSEALSSASAKPSFDGPWKATVSAFVAIFFIVNLVWLFGNDPITFRAKIYLKPLVVALGWIQNWAVFTPKTRHTIHHESAIITFADDSQKIYEFPRMEKLDYWQKFRHEKLRASLSDTIAWPGNENYLPSLAALLAKSNANPVNQPTKVTLIMNYMIIPPPQEGRILLRDALPEHSNKMVFFIYKVKPRDLTTDPLGLGLADTAVSC